MSSIDDVKRRLSIDEMDSESRNDLFNKFVDGGGEVIKEKRVRQSVDFNRDKQREFHNTIKEHRKKIEASNPNFTKPIESNYPKEYHSIRVFWRGVFSHYFSLSTDLNRRYLHCLKNEFVEILTTLSYITSEIVSMDMENRIGIIDSLNKDYPYAYEIVLRIYDLYKGQYIEKFQNHYNRYKSILCPHLIDALSAFYKDLVILYPYQSTIKNTLLKAMDFNKHLTGKNHVLSDSKLNKYVDTLFNYILPGFHLILVYNLGFRYKFDVASMRKLAKITDQEDLGSMYKMITDEKKQFLADKEKEKEEQKKALEEDIEKREKEKIPKFTQKGLQIIDNILEKMPKFLKNNPKYKTIFQPNEKMLYYCCLMDEFEKEYSFILTTNQIKLNISMENGHRIDVKSEFEEENIKYNEIASLIKEYVSHTEEYIQVGNTFANSRIVLTQKRTAIDVKRAQLVNEVRVKCLGFFKKLCISLQKLITDYNGQQIMLVNGDEALHFQVELGDIRKFEKIKIINAIAATFSLASGLEYYLTYDKLSTRGLFLEEEIKPKNETAEKKDKQDTKETNKPENSEQTKNESQKEQPVQKEENKQTSETKAKEKN